MDWIEAWREGRTNFHKHVVNENLLRFRDRCLAQPSRVLVPLCGKSLDLAWLAAQGHEVVGIELSEIAVRALFQEAGRTPVVEGDLYRSPGLSVFCADVFTVTPARLAATWTTTGPVRVWDRAAMIALPPEHRARYAPHLRALAGPGAEILLDTLVYDQATMQGPPFSVPEDEVRARYAGATVEVLSDDALEVDARFVERGLTWMRELVIRVCP